MCHMVMKANILFLGRMGALWGRGRGDDDAGLLCRWDLDVLVTCFKIAVKLKQMETNFLRH